jgi:uncharacterized membrane protein
LAPRGIILAAKSLATVNFSWATRPVFCTVRSMEPPKYRPTLVVGIFALVSAFGGLIKLPSPVGSIALDSAPGYFAAAYYGPVVGGTVGFIGHIASAATAGFPLVWYHPPIAILMFGCCALYGAIVRRFDSNSGLVCGSVIASLANTSIPLVLYLVRLYPKAIAFGILPFLLVASCVNVALASIGYAFLSRLRIRGI